MSIIGDILETSEESVERKIRECKTSFNNVLGRDPTEKEIEAWLIDN